MDPFDLLIINIYLFTLFSTLVRLKVHIILFRLMKISLMIMFAVTSWYYVINFELSFPEILIHNLKFIPMVLVFFVVTQNDIKFILQKLKIKRFMGINFYEQAQNSLINGIQYLVDHRYGAILVIQRDDDLSEYVNKASLIKAPINEDLIASIFIPHSPIHDGAVIIVDQVMVCAGAYFPTSESQSIPKRLGSRHRAGLGVSEVTDAFVIIVSEETGEVSVALDGKLDLDISKESLLLYLNQYFLQ